MSTLTTPDAWKEMCQLLESRKQVLDNALVKTLDDQCSASYFQVVRSLMLDQERLLHWFLEHKPTVPDRIETGSCAREVKPTSSLTSSSSAIKRAGFLKPGLMAILGFIFFFLLFLLVLLTDRMPNWTSLEKIAATRHEMPMNMVQMARHLHKSQYVLQIPISCCIMESANDPAFKNATGSWENADASAPARPAFPYQDGVSTCY